jgi:hypothetical protein
MCARNPNIAAKELRERSCRRHSIGVGNTVLRA